MLAISNMSFYFGSRPLYKDANLHIKPKDRIGLIGANGTGKSTLLRLISGEYAPDEGTISKAKDCTIGFLNQDLLSYLTNESILEVAMQAFEEQNQLQEQIDKTLHEMEVNYTDSLVDKLAKLQERFEMLGGYSMQAKAEEILEGLGFKTADLQRPLQEFSGGWRMRVMLAKLLLQKPALLMLDEPTNHLDLPSIQWIENYIHSYEGAIIVVSHDRQFLDNAVKTTVEVSQAKLNIYAGNYSFYLKERELRQEIQQSAYENQQDKIRQTERFIERFRSKSTKARQVQSRVKALEKMDLIDEVIDETAKVNFKFNFGQKSGRQVMELDNIGKAYGDLTILKNTTARIERGDKIALVGANGKGKSTLLRIIAGTEQIKGERKLGHNVLFSFFAQHQLESLVVENEILEELKQAGSAKTETELRSVLGCFLFKDDDVFKKIKILSGGEKSRVALAKVLISEANFLLLDEPTNHLDIQSVNILMQALDQYEGTFVVVSHDRHFISQVANKIWYIEDEEIKEYLGTFAEYNDWYQKQLAKKMAQAAAPQEKKKKEKKPKPQDSPEIKAIKREIRETKMALEKAEAKVTKSEKKQEEIELKLADNTIYNDPEKLEKTQQEFAKVQEELAAANDAWEELVMKIDELEAQL
ncbi:ABC-F family ATP-binding cassette domain-containing protein [Microscilla marina]|uniref:ABC transporter, ATP-binding protein n=1 Tax=Microscilla marina ATCC 23134 TaxID=313606 RepID=A1ZYX6_MICM2|nr:ABC-F family ATP-binding cassette domain-containing protein [Microscilla marina]EAY24412.1 ABC transporter, ATP-binding protein [Microscilla marina ATCC 23134]